MFLNKSELKKSCQPLLNDFDGLLSWDWDNRSQTLLAEFPTIKGEVIRAVMNRHLTQQWDNKTIHQAPERLRTATGDLGDLRANQLLFSSGPDSQPLIFAAWWPWGNGEVISLRLASPTTSDHQVAPAEPGLLNRIMGLFR